MVCGLLFHVEYKLASSKIARILPEPSRKTLTSFDLNVVHRTVRRVQAFWGTLQASALIPATKADLQPANVAV